MKRLLLKSGKYISNDTIFPSNVRTVKVIFWCSWFMNGCAINVVMRLNIKKDKKCTTYI